MEVVNCPRCGKVFNKVRGPLCPACEKKDEQAFQMVREFAEENKNCTISELSKGSGVSEKKIMRYIREGRLEITGGMHGEVRCKICGRPISKGNYCDSCIIDISQNISEVFSSANNRSNRGTTMHISDHPHK